MFFRIFLNEYNLSSTLHLLNRMHGYAVITFAEEFLFRQFYDNYFMKYIGLFITR